MSSIRVDTSPWIASSVVVGDPGGGVAASLIPDDGEHGPALLYQFVIDSSLSAEEIRALITTPPVSGTLFVYEDTSFVYDGPVPTSFQIQPYVDYVASGDPVTVSIVSADEESFTAEAGSFALTGGSLEFAVAAALTLESGSFVLAGGDVAFSASVTTELDGGVFTLTGGDVDFLAETATSLDVGVFSLTGGVVNFEYDGERVYRINGVRI
jgi:hypothetical protein